MAGLLAGNLTKGEHFAPRRKNWRTVSILPKEAIWRRVSILPKEAIWRRVSILPKEAIWLRVSILPRGGNLAKGEHFAPRRQFG